MLYLNLVTLSIPLFYVKDSVYSAFGSEYSSRYTVESSL